MAKLTKERAEWQALRCQLGHEHPEFKCATRLATSVVGAATAGFATDRIDAAESAWNDLYRTLQVLKAIRTIATPVRRDPHADIVDTVGAFLAEYQEAWLSLERLGIPSGDDRTTIAPHFAAVLGEAANQVKAVRTRLNDSLGEVSAELLRVRACLRTSGANRPKDPATGDSAKTTREHVVASQIIAILTDPDSGVVEDVNLIRECRGQGPIPWVTWNDTELAEGFKGLFGDDHPLSEPVNVKALRFRLRRRSPNR